MGVFLVCSNKSTVHRTLHNLTWEGDLSDTYTLFLTRYKMVSPTYKGKEGRRGRMIVGFTTTYTM